ncbi:MAG: hypothetical protein LUD27_01825 [Clostridia bacterium]|nr:hypothetical protein [Clostridia bacterium]
MTDMELGPFVGRRVTALLKGSAGGSRVRYGKLIRRRKNSFDKTGVYVYYFTRIDYYKMAYIAEDFENIMLNETEDEEAEGEPLHNEAVTDKKVLAKKLRGLIK